jgi:hypothetical protein
MHERIYLTCLQVLSESKIEYLWMLTRVFSISIIKILVKFNKSFAKLSKSLAKLVNLD